MRKSIEIKQKTFEAKVFTITFNIENSFYTKQVAAYNLSDAISNFDENKFNMKTYFTHTELSFDGFRSLMKNVYSPN